ncbi:DUF1028 domain-containing protein [Leptobacterium flavescens]|uniref:DUF1028 domain-containing protein n=1 Tax=Leptobacterium flavescens TaxID=472055 RepID=A0A6P0UG20_9FLAO|nr:DUF1028 domain-containing protein [Leptobacterium flavescens]NER11967.1 DUF1028 domain-containing protein [Leptobacterium flavescens]
MKKLLLSLGVLMLSLQASAQFYSKDAPFAHTYSIVARDTVTGEMGVAVQSHWFSVGTSVAWGKSGVGVVATQSFTNKSFGPRGLTLMKNGLTAKLAMDALLEVDEGRGVRQLAILDASGNVAAHTGKDCIEAAGHYVGNNFSVQANLMEKASVWPAMAKAFEETKGSLAERMLAALEAAQAEGGDIRGKQSAALLVVGAENTGNEWDDKLVDLRVDDHATPLKELRRLLNIQQAYQYMNAGDVAVEKGNIKEAKKMYQKAQQLNPENVEMKYWYAVTLANNKEFEASKPVFKGVFEKDRKWQQLLSRLKKVNLLLITDKELKELEKL